MHAPADGVAPAVLFSVAPLQKGPEVIAGHLATLQGYAYSGMCIQHSENELPAC